MIGVSSAWSAPGGRAPAACQRPELGQGLAVALSAAGARVMALALPMALVLDDLGQLLTDPPQLLYQPTVLRGIQRGHGALLRHALSGW